MRCNNDYNPKSIAERLSPVLEQIQKSNVSISDLKHAIGLIENISEILIRMNIQLPPLSTRQTPEISNECILHNELLRLRTLSIELLNSKKPIRLQQKSTKNSHSSKNTPEGDVIHKKRNRRKNSIQTKNELVETCSNIATGGVGILDICYICKRRCLVQIQRHMFYPWMCVKCGDVNYEKRFQTAELSGKVALVTGGRIKIGFEIVLKLLRCGASVVMTTRFPKDAQNRFGLQEDFSVWSTRLHIYKIDLRFIPQIERFCEFILSTFKQLDIVIQNAAQTIRRPSAYYKSLIDGEVKGGSINSNKETFPFASSSPQIKSPLEISYMDTSQLLLHPEDLKYDQDLGLSQQHFPYGSTDQDGDQLDLRPENSWIATLEEVATEEMIEVTFVNYMAPYIILQKLTPLMQQGPNSKSNSWRFIVLVSAMEGKFSDCKKTGKHPHTNAAKAALNMLVKTSALHYKKMGILMNAVDTGWVTDEHPIGYKSRLISGLKTPLDSIDGAARVLDPILQTVNGNGKCPVYGKFLKDYQNTGW